MAQITVAVKNDTSDDQNVHVYDQFANGHREVQGSPFALAPNEQSTWFGVNAGGNGRGSIEYRCDGGPTLSNIEVTDRQVVNVD